MREWKTRGHVESELVIVIEVLVSDLDELVSTFDDDLLLKNWIEHWINFVLNRFDQDWESFSKWNLKLISQVWMTESEDAIILFELWLSCLDPMDGLTLWINHQWISG